MEAKRQRALEKGQQEAFHYFCMGETPGLMTEKSQCQASS